MAQNPTQMLRTCCHVYRVFQHRVSLAREHVDEYHSDNAVEGERGVVLDEAGAKCVTGGHLVREHGGSKRVVQRLPPACKAQAHVD